MALNTYDELVALGEIHEWSEDPQAQEVARAERFNRNEETAINQAIQAYIMAKDYVDQISTNVDGAKANIASSLVGYGILDAFTKDEVNALVETAVSAIVGMAPAQLDTLKEIADKIALSDSDIAGILSVLAGKAALSQVYERGVIDMKLDGKADNATMVAELLLKADASSVYTKAEIDGKFNQYADADLSVLTV
jgi:hypothetical protein